MCPGRWEGTWRKAGRKITSVSIFTQWLSHVKVSCEPILSCRLHTEIQHQSCNKCHIPVPACHHSLRSDPILTLSLPLEADYRLGHADPPCQVCVWQNKPTSNRQCVMGNWITLEICTEFIFCICSSDTMITSGMFNLVGQFYASVPCTEASWV